MIPCATAAGTCRHKHVAAPLGLVPNPRRPGDFEGTCPECGHGGFAFSAPDRSRTLRSMWSCNCKKCNRGRGCLPGVLRAALLRLGISARCLGDYDGSGGKEVPAETARKLQLAVSDILAIPHLKPADMRIILAEAQGQKVPEEFRPFVKFDISLGIGKTQAQEAAARWGCRPSDSRPQTRGAVADASRNTQPGVVVKRGSSGARGRSVSDQEPVGFRPTDISDTRTSEAIVPQQAQRSVSGQRTPKDESGMTQAIKALNEGGLTGRRVA